MNTKLFILLLIAVGSISSCTMPTPQYHFEALITENSNTKVCCLTEKIEDGKIVISGRLYRNSILNSTPPGYVSVAVYNPNGVLLAVQDGNYHQPVSNKEWSREGVFFAITLDINPPKNSIIKVGFNNRTINK